MDFDQLQELATQLQGGNDRQRRAAAYKLGKSKDPAAVSALTNAYNDPDASVRQNVIDGLRAIGTPAALAFLASHEVKPQPMDPVVGIQQKLILGSKIQNGINWFYWIAALSLINTVIYLFGSTFVFIFGLGITQVVDGFMLGLARNLSSAGGALRLVGLGIDICIAGFFALLGFFGRRRYRWLIIVGMVLYTLDGLILLLFREFVAAAFHAWALFGIWAAYRAIQELEIMERSGAGETLESLQQRIPALAQSRATPVQIRTRLILIGLIMLVFVACFIILGLSGR